MKDLPIEIKDIEIKGNLRTRKSLFENELSDVVNSKKIKDLHDSLVSLNLRLREMEVFESVDIMLDISESTPSKYVTGIVIGVKEASVPLLKVSTVSKIVANLQSCNMIFNLGGYLR